MNDRAQQQVESAQGIVDDAWREVLRGLYTQQTLGIVPEQLPDLSEAEASRRTGVGRALVARLNAVDEGALPHDLALSLRLVRFRAGIWAREEQMFWIACDPLAIGFFGMFLPTAYCGGFLFNFVHGIVRSFRFKTPSDLDRYLGLGADYARMVDQMTERTVGQAARGMRMPVPQVVATRALVGAFRDRSFDVWNVSGDRLGTLDSTRFKDALDGLIRQRIVPAFDRLLELFGDDYVAKAPAGVGLSQYAGGGEVYQQLVRIHTTQDLTPQQVFEAGSSRMARIGDEMNDVRREAGFHGDGRTFLAQMAENRRWRAETAQDIAGFFQRYIDRLRPRLGGLFRHETPIAYGVDPLPAALQGSMTFGYYDAPRPDRQKGVYLFNSANLSKQPLHNLAALTYHELVPGHHLHLATQHRNDSLHEFRRHSFVNAYNEGWAEYAATLAGEAGMYEEPEERYGRLVMDAFLTSRLVVDTGMNALGWSLEQARDYMRAHSGMSETEILSETLRYSCDLPGQALAYKLGDTFILGQREKMRTALGAAFDIRDFHGAVLGPGSLPLDDLAWHLEYETARLTRQRDTR